MTAHHSQGRHHLVMEECESVQQQSGSQLGCQSVEFDAVAAEDNALSPDEMEDLAAWSFHFDHVDGWVQGGLRLGNPNLYPSSHRLGW